MKTAVELLANELKNNHGIDLKLYNEFDKAKEMEKEQRMNAYLQGIDSDLEIRCEEQYYNETFKSE